MGKKLFLLAVMFVMVGWCRPPVFALDTMGPPSSGLEKGQFSAGADYSYTRMKIELDNGKIVDKLYQFGSLATTSSNKIGSFELKDLEMHKTYANIGYGIADNWETFLRLGGMNTEFSGNLFSTTSSQGRDYNGDTGFAIGFGTKTTFYEKDQLKLGGLFQMSWASSNATFKFPNLKESVELDIVEMQIAVGPTYNLAQNIVVYGGPFWHLISLEDSKVKGDKNQIWPSQSEQKISKATYDIDDVSYFGCYVGIEAQITINTFYCIEYQHTVSADALAMGIRWKF